MNFWSYAKILRILPANGSGPLIGINGPSAHLLSYRETDQSTKRRHLLRQSFGLQRLMHFRASADARHISAKVRIGFEIYSYEIRPVNDRKCVRICDRKIGVAHVARGKRSP